MISEHPQSQDILEENALFFLFGVWQLSLISSKYLLK